MIDCTLKISTLQITPIPFRSMPKITNDNNNRSETIELALPKFDSETEAKGIDDVWERYIVSIGEISSWFNQYQVDSIELWISGVMETGSITRLVVNAKGEGGMKVVLKPKAER